MQQESRKQEAAVELLKRREARKNLHSFIQYINPDYIVSDFSRQVCEALDEFIIKMINGERPVIVLGAPPQHGKSDIVSRYLPAYIFGNYPDLRIAGLSYAKDLASDMNRDVQRIMMSEEYSRLFPKSCLNSKRVVTVEMEAKRNSETFEIMGRKGTYISQGVGGPLTGKKVDLGIIDDPIKNAKEALSGTIKNAVWNWYVSTFKTRLSRNSGEIIMATRWAVDDLSGKVIEKNKNAKVLAFPAIDEFGRALVPELHPVDKLLETKAILGSYFWSAMYQQSPVPEDGGIFKPEKIDIIDALPTGIKWIRGWDFAGTVKKTSDYTSSTKLGIKDGITYIANVDRFRGAPDDVENRLKQISTIDGYETVISLPQDPGQAGVYQKSAFSRLLQGMNFEFSPESGDKMVRAAPFASQVNVGNVKMLRGDWNSDFIDELRDFPNGAHDDMVDSTSRAYNKASSKPLSAFDVLF